MLKQRKVISDRWIFTKLKSSYPQQTALSYCRDGGTQRGILEKFCLLLVFKFLFILQKFCVPKAGNYLMHPLKKKSKLQISNQNKILLNEIEVVLKFFSELQAQNFLIQIWNWITWIWVPLVWCPIALMFRVRRKLFLLVIRESGILAAMKDEDANHLDLFRCP